MLIVFFFCFKQKTAYEMRISDWSSDVCSSDLSVGKKVVSVLPLAFSAENRAARLRIHLWLPLIKGERLDWALQKATEMGAASIQQIGRASCRESVCQYV